MIHVTSSYVTGGSHIRGYVVRVYDMFSTCYYSTQLREELQPLSPCFKDRHVGFGTTFRHTLLPYEPVHLLLEVRSLCLCLPIGK